MSLTIAATFDEPNGAMILTCTSSVDHAAGEFVLTRTDAAGTAEVRLLEGQGFSGGDLLAFDYECALTGLVTYTLTAGGEEATTSATPSTARTWLMFPIFPQYSLEVATLGRDYGAQYVAADEVVHPIDSPHPVVMLQPLTSRVGTFELEMATYADGLAIVRAYQRVRTALLRVPAPVGVSMYHITSQLELVPGAERSPQWLLRATYTEQQRPTGHRLGTLGWTYADSTATGRTYAESTALARTYAERSLGGV